MIAKQISNESVEEMHRRQNSDAHKTNSYNSFHCEVGRSKIISKISF